MSKTISVGIFGAGGFANNQHLPNLTNIEGVDIIAVCDVNENSAKETARRFLLLRLALAASLAASYLCDRVQPCTCARG